MLRSISLCLKENFRLAKVVDIFLVCVWGGAKYTALFAGIAFSLYVHNDSN